MIIKNGAVPYVDGYRKIHGRMEPILAIETIAARHDGCFGCCYSKRQCCGTPCTPYRPGGKLPTNFHRVKVGQRLKDENGRFWIVRDKS